MILVTWELASEDEYPILAYRCFDSSLPIFKYRSKSISHKKQDGTMFIDNVEISRPRDEIVSGERRYYRMRLPYTKDALMNRLANGGDIPNSLFTKKQFSDKVG